MRVRGLRKSYGAQRVLQGVDADLHEGEVVLLEGANGSGKTTLLNILTGNLQPDAGAIELFTHGTKETFAFPRHWWQNLNPLDHFLPERVAREGVGRSWQDTRLFPSVNLEDNIAVATPSNAGESPLNVFFRPRSVRHDEREAHAQADACLDGLGLKARAHSSADMISLGQTKRIAIARAARAGGRVLFLDEPLAGLDAEGIQAVLRLLRQLVSEHHMTLVIVEHVWSAHHIAGFATTLWTLRNGRVKAKSLEQRSRRSTRVPQDAGFAYMQGFLSGLRLVETHPLPNGATLSMYRLGEKRTAREQPILEIRNICVRRGHRLVIGDDASPDRKGVSFALHDGIIAVLQAPNGWGKTTLLETLAGLVPAETGSVHLLANDVTAAPPWNRAQAGLHFLRASNRMFPSLTVGESFLLSGSTKSSDRATPLRGQGARYLSGGEQQALSLSQMAATLRHMYLLDEPFSALDGKHLKQTFEMIRNLARHPGRAVLMAMPATNGALNSIPRQERVRR